MLPGVFIATWVYTRLCRRFDREKVFYITVTGFLSFFLIFAFLLYPNREVLHLTKTANYLNEILPLGCKGMVAMLRNWTYTFFYIICELWSVLVLSVLFWGFANDVTPLKQAKRSYGILNIGSNIAPIFGGFLAIFFSQAWVSSYISSSAATSSDPWGQTLINLVVIVTILGVGAMGMFYWIHRKILPETDTSEEMASRKKKSPRLSMRKSIRYILKSKYLTSLAIIVLGYNIAINITDVLWKEQLKKYFTDPNEMLRHMNLITVGIGVIATQGALFFSIMIRRLGWTFIAILTPLLMTVMALGFFVFLFSGDMVSSIALTLFGASPLALTVYFGSMQNCLSKAGKYSVFDGSKELAFLPLNAESKLKGKAAIDGLGSGVGKSGASLLYQGLILMTGSIALSTPFVACVLFSVLFAWLASVFNLGKRFAEASEEKVPAPESSYEELIEES